MACLQQNVLGELCCQFPWRQRMGCSAAWRCYRGTVVLMPFAFLQNSPGTPFPKIKAQLQKLAQIIVDRTQLGDCVPNFIVEKKKKDFCTAMGHKAVSKVVPVVWWYEYTNKSFSKLKCHILYWVYPFFIIGCAVIVLISMKNWCVKVGKQVRFRVKSALSPGSDSE